MHEGRKSDASKIKLILLRPKVKMLFEVRQDKSLLSKLGPLQIITAFLFVYLSLSSKSFFRDIQDSGFKSQISLRLKREAA
jgi:hypothetical protein